MKRTCPNTSCAAPDFIVNDGFYRRKDDSKMIQRFRCMNCGKRFSSATFSDTYRQKRRRINARLFNYLSSGVSQRRAAILLRTNRKTIERRIGFLAKRARERNTFLLSQFQNRIHNVQIDDLITKENSKLKPLTVSIAVDENRRFILGAEVSQIPAFGHLSKIAIHKYGPRKDEHRDGLKRLFEFLRTMVVSEAVFKSDEHQKYPWFIGEYFPLSKHLTFKSERSCVAGQGELKKVAHDPLFIVNHTCAILRANINRLIRKTWCTTKDKYRLKDHLDIFICFYNERLLRTTLSPPL